MISGLRVFAKGLASLKNGQKRFLRFFIGVKSVKFCLQRIDRVA